MGSQTRTVDVKEERKVELKFSNCQPSDVTISVSGGKGAYVDDIQVYTFVTRESFITWTAVKENALKPCGL